MDLVLIRVEHKKFVSVIIELQTKGKSAEHRPFQNETTLSNLIISSHLSTPKPLFFAQNATNRYGFLPKILTEGSARQALFVCCVVPPPDYGAKGITVCDEWRKNVKSFIAFALALGYKDGLNLTRIDKRGNFEPSNMWLRTDEELKLDNQKVYWLKVKFTDDDTPKTESALYWSKFVRKGKGRFMQSAEKSIENLREALLHKGHKVDFIRAVGERWKTAKDDCVKGKPRPMFPKKQENPVLELHLYARIFRR